MEYTWPQWGLKTIREAAEDAGSRNHSYVDLDCPSCGRRRLEPEETAGGWCAVCEKCKWSSGSECDEDSDARTIEDLEIAVRKFVELYPARFDATMIDFERDGSWSFVALECGHESKSAEAKTLEELCRKIEALL